MSKIPNISFWLPDAIKTQFAGESLANTLYTLPLTILLTGELGAGKTTFLQGFAKKLGIEEHVTSPTYALEQRYRTSTGIPFVHLDLYRLTHEGAADIVRQTDDFEGIRCIEWADRLPAHTQWERTVRLHFLESGNGRTLDIAFGDMPLPYDALINEWRKDMQLPRHIIAHCETVASVAEKLASLFMERGVIVRTQALVSAARLHDLLRFIDFRGAGPKDIEEDPNAKQRWDSIRTQYAGMNHEDACAVFLETQGYPELASIVRLHGVRHEPQFFTTIEQKLLFYADKRVIHDRVTTINERFTDFTIRYGDGKRTRQQELWFEQTLNVERGLFPDGAPAL